MMVETSLIVQWDILHNIPYRNFIDTESQWTVNWTTHPPFTCGGKLADEEMRRQKVFMSYAANGRVNHNREHRKTQGTCAPEANFKNP